MDMSDIARNSVRMWAIMVNTAETDYLDEMLEMANIDTDLRIAGKMYQMNRKYYPRYVSRIWVKISASYTYHGITKL